MTERRQFLKAGAALAVRQKKPAEPDWREGI